MNFLKQLINDIMKVLFIICACLLAACALASDGFWLTTKFEVGHNEYFLVTKANFGKDSFEKLSIAPGVNLRLTETLKLKQTSGLEFRFIDQQKPQPFFNINLELKL
tara:strand:- start:24 stop:344 length:321 start_codon:yes stop_codon:yes gene_type:complete